MESEVAYTEAVIEEREQGIQEIQTQIAEVNEIFRDLAVLVKEQGVMIGEYEHTVLYCLHAFVCNNQALHLYRRTRFVLLTRVAIDVRSMEFSATCPILGLPRLCCSCLLGSMPFVEGYRLITMLACLCVR